MGGVRVEKWVLRLEEIDKGDVDQVGGKGANLGELAKAGFPVPGGFCVSTESYRTFLQTSSEMSQLLDQLAELQDNGMDQINPLGQRIRNHLESLPVPEEVQRSIIAAWQTNGSGKSYAVRSSATAEDLPSASFAGQQETYLNVRGQEQLIKAVRKCWASLFTDRAIAYRQKNGFGHRNVLSAVVIQEMVFPEVSGIMFTADPINNRRQTVCIDASFGLGEALVSGIVSADLYQVRFGKIIKKQISQKKKAIYALPEGGTISQELSSDQQVEQALPDDKIMELAELGRRIEKHYGMEQDIEWCFAQGNFQIVQSRPITSLFPLIPVTDDKLHVFVSFGHPQMMTEAMKPLAVSSLRCLFNIGKRGSVPAENRFVPVAGGRLYGDVTGLLHVKPMQRRLQQALMDMDELEAAAIAEVVTRPDLELSRSSLGQRKFLRVGWKGLKILLPLLGKTIYNVMIRDPVKGRDSVAMLIEQFRHDSKKYIEEVSGAERIRRIMVRIGDTLPLTLSDLIHYPAAGILASKLLEKLLAKRFNDSAALISRLSRSLPGNVTAELGLMVGDLADVAREYPEVVAYLGNARNETFYAGLLQVRGGSLFMDELDKFIAKYGMRCAGEIDLTSPRWAEDPTQLMPALISHINSVGPGEHRAKFRKGEVEAEHATQEIEARLGFFQRQIFSRLVKVYRNFFGMRENHKYLLILNFGVFKQAILDEGRSLVHQGILHRAEDVFFLTLPELLAVEEGRLDRDIPDLIAARQKQHAFEQKLTPPRVMTSEGEIITSKRRSTLAPEGALVGTPVSAGVVEGVARVVRRLEDARLRPGEILVAPYTDPGWTPLFNSATGLITEVGGMMTHGSVVAREYGIPAVVGIESATQIIPDGAYIRLDGTQGFVQIIQ